MRDQIILLFAYIDKLAHPLRRPGLLGIIKSMLEEDSRLQICKNTQGQTPIFYAEALGLPAGIMQQLREIFDGGGAAEEEDTGGW